MCPISSRDWSSGITSLRLMNIAPSSASAADDMTALIILEIVNTAPLLGGKYVFVDIDKFPPALLLDSVLERYEASLWPSRTISLVCYVIMAYVWVDA